MRPLPLLLLLAVLIAGCGPMERAELKRGVESLRAVAAEGRLLADGAAGDRTRSTYTRVHARTLGEDVQHEAEKLADATPVPEVTAERDDAVQLAGRLTQSLGDLQTQPGAEDVAGTVRDDLKRVEDDLDTLDQKLQ
jgi:predicted small secreted protein